MSKHTLGPWRWQYDIVGIGNKLLAADGRPVLDYADYENMWFGRYDPDEDSANARLIAAAPDLLAALEEIIALGVFESLVKGPSREKALAAIAKAKGEKP